MSAPDEARWLRETYDRLPMASCNGCEGCATRCMGNLSITRTEFRAIREYLGGEIYHPIVRHAAQMAAPCEFSDPYGPRCLVYPVRPLICRLFGIVEWLPCPRGVAPTVIADGPQIFACYRQLDRKSFREWMRESASVDAGPNHPTEANWKDRLKNGDSGKHDSDRGTGG